MTNRLSLTKDHMVVSKRGFDATNPSLPEGDKLFDSNWLFAGTVHEVGIHYDTSSYRFTVPPQGLIRWDEGTDWDNTQIINFTPLDYIPTVLLISLSDPRYWQSKGLVLFGSEPIIANRPNDYYRMGEIRVTKSQIIIPRVRSPSWRYRESFIYLIMAM